ncbi:DUF748 domain-containing protein [Paralcaligenes sp. KSB-10]|uniref:DUF748 domain-containing protein n=1 Tax=Paralcaligenes sp. KSB-10 TaxID=2901142 RepID=UPI001E609AF4|nr:DUF748 domain-containing protein [Paralcaligenes sp. KSB-10]UHL63904.1 DUF748 domain-containing protein [Paralcaligenes sp. KSB-10]
MRLRMPVPKLSRRAGKILAGAVLTLLVLAGLAAWLMPKVVHNALTQDVSQVLGREVTVGKITFNPFTLALRARGITIGQPGATPLLQIGEVDLRVAWRSIVMFAPVIDRIHIDQPKFTLVRQDATHFNFSDIVDRIVRMSADKPTGSKPAKTGLPRFSLNNMSLTRGVISLDDHVTGRQQVIDQLTLGIPFISSFGYATHIDVQPKVHMSINGSPFDLTGTARPFDKIPVSTLNVVFTGLGLAKWADFWPLPLPVKVKHALLDSKLQVLFEQPPDAAPHIRVQGGLALRQLDVSEASGAPLLAWDDLQVGDIDIDPSTRAASIGTVALTKPRVEMHRDARQWNWQRVAEGFAKLSGSSAPATSSPAKAATTSASGTPVADTVPAVPVSAAPAAPSAWKISVDDVKLNAGEVHLRDDPIGLDYPLGGVTGEARHIAMPQTAGQPMALQLSVANVPGGGSLQIHAPVVLQPLSVNAQIQLSDLALAPFAAAIRHVAPLTVRDGRLNLEGKVNVANSRIEARDVKLGLRKLEARDETVKPGVNLSIGSLMLEADRLAPDATPTTFALQADGIQKRGTLALKGVLVAQPLSVKTSVNLANFDVASLAPYIASSLNATVRSVLLGARGSAEFAAAHSGKPMSVDWRGGAQVHDLDLKDRVNKADFLNWKRLDLSNMHVSMAGPKLSLGLGDIVLDDFYGNILLNNQAHLNVTDIMVSKGNAAGSITQDTQTRRSDTAKKGQAGPEEPKARAAKKSVARPEPRRTGGEPDISISSVRLERGRMTFNDHFVRPNYRAELSSIHGTLTAVSSVKPAPAKVSVTGRVYSTAPFSVSGTVQPFSRHLALDIKASAKGVDLPRFTTYSSKYVGYAIQRGKLTVDLQYQIKNRALQASNKVQLNQLTFGKPSNSPDALKLPVLLAVALLKDSNGNIDIDLPIAGSLDDPQFSVGGIVVRVIMNTLVKVVSSPFKLLASAFGGSQEDLSYIDFAPGSAALDDKAKSSIETLAKALTDRPALKMDIIGHADPKSDETGLRQAWLDDQLRKAKGTASRGRTPDPKGVALTDADRAKYLEKVYRDTNIKGKPRNFVGMAKSQPPDQMKAMLLAVAPLGRQALHNLAEARAQAVYEQLQETAQNLTSRVFIVAPKLDAKDAKDGEATRVEFALH